MYRYPFGRPVEPRRSFRNRGGYFVLGAYPSALHVHWTAPSGAEIAALAVDNEPAPFGTAASSRSTTRSTAASSVA
jgi:hypothetical protein